MIGIRPKVHCTHLFNFQEVDLIFFPSCIWAWAFALNNLFDQNIHYWFCTMFFRMFIFVSVVLSRMGGRLCFPSGVAWFFRFWCLLFWRNVFLMWSVLYCFALHIFHRMLILLPCFIFALLLVYLGLCSLWFYLVSRIFWLPCMCSVCFWNLHCMTGLFWNQWQTFAYVPKHSDLCFVFAAIQCL